MASKKDSALYNVPRQKHISTNTLPSSSTLAFTTQLSSLIASSKSSASSASLPRPSSTKSLGSNPNVKKRALADLAETAATSQKHKRSKDIDSIDDDVLARSRRKMEEKAALYKAMKRGDFIDEEEREDRQGLVDFDRKWAEEERRRKEKGGVSDDDDAEDSDDNGSEIQEDRDEASELIEYEDEFGRTRTGTKREYAKYQSAQLLASKLASGSEKYSARPSMPSNLIYGDAVQAAAFNPDETIAERMAEIAAKRDKEATPPPEKHYDANWEIRSKGAGFYSFSQDAETRKEEMSALERERKETEKVRGKEGGAIGVDKKKEERRRMIEERRKKVEEARGKKRAERFLEELGG